MNFSNYIAKRLLNNQESSKNISRPIVRIGVIGIALGVAVMIITVSVITGFQKQIIQKITTFTSHAQICHYDENQSMEPMPIVIDENRVNELRKIPNIRHIQAYATKNGILKTKSDNEGIVLKGVTFDYDWSQLKSYVVEGSVLSLSKDSIGKDIFISQSLANKLHLKINQKLLVYFITKKKLSDTTSSGENFIRHEPRVKDFYIKGIFNTGFEEFDNNLVFVDLRQIQKLNYWEHNQVAGYEVYVNDFNVLDSSLETLNDQLGYLYKVVSVKQLQSAIFNWLDMIDVNAVIIITLMVLVAAINMISALLILILEQTTLIGILKALGLSNVHVRKIFLNLSFRLLAKGLLFGNLIGLSLCFLQMHLKIISLNPETYYLASVPINLSLSHIIAINFGTLVICLLMMVLPTFLIYKITPMRAIRFS